MATVTRRVPTAGLRYTLPVIGDIAASAEVLSDPDFRLRMFRRHGDAVALRMFGNAVVMLRGEANMARIYAKNSPFHADEAFGKSTAIVIGRKQLTQVHGEEHARLRTCLNHHFTRRAVLNGGYAPLISAMLAEHTAAHPAGAPFNFDEVATRVTFGMIALFMGFPDGWDIDELRGLYRQVVAGMFALTVHLPGTSTSFTRAVQARRRIVEMVRRGCEAGRFADDTLVGILWRIKNQGVIPEEEFDNNLILIGVAGFGTTSDSMNSLAYEYLANAPFREALRAEVAGVAPGELLAAAADGRLRVAEAGIAETLRVHNPVPTINRVVVEPVEIDGCRIEAGTKILVCIRETMLDERLYPDPERFDHRRWLERSPPKFGFVPFGLGEHHCLGVHLAELELRIFAAMLATTLPLELVDDRLVSDVIRGTGRLMVRRP